MNKYIFLLFLATSVFSFASKAENYREHVHQISCLNCDHFLDASKNDIKPRVLTPAELGVGPLGAAVYICLAFYSASLYRGGYNVGLFGLYLGEVLLKASIALLNLPHFFYYHIKNLVGLNTQDALKGSILLVREKTGWNLAHHTVPSTANLESSYLVFKAKVDDVEQLNNAISEVVSSTHLPIRALVIGAHANNNVVIIGNEVVMTLDSVKLRELSKVFEKLAPDAHIILNSCSAGSSENFEDLRLQNIAQALAQQANGRKVFASTNQIVGDIRNLDEETLIPSFNSLSHVLLPFGVAIDYDVILGNTRCYQKNPQTGRVELCEVS